jgi:hypothetical protein
MILQNVGIYSSTNMASHPTGFESPATTLYYDEQK